jgi:hypothetical protein
VLDGMSHTAPAPATPDAVLDEVLKWALAGHISDYGITSEAGVAIRAAAAGPGAVGELKCKGCGGTIDQHTKLLHCRCDQTRYCAVWPDCDPPCHLGRSPTADVSVLDGPTSRRSPVTPTIQPASTAEK